MAIDDPCSDSAPIAPIAASHCSFDAHPVRPTPQVTAQQPPPLGRALRPSTAHAPAAERRLDCTYARTQQRHTGAHCRPRSSRGAASLVLLRRAMSQDSAVPAPPPCRVAIAPPPQWRPASAAASQTDHPSPINHRRPSPSIANAAPAALPRDPHPLRGSRQTASLGPVDAAPPLSSSAVHRLSIAAPLRRTLCTTSCIPHPTARPHGAADRHNPRRSAERRWGRARTKRPPRRDAVA